jgi:ATP-dependent Clp protease ATP-binding subunit ClpA
VQSSGKDAIDGGNLLVAFYRERDSHAVWLLEQQGVRRLDVLNYVAHGISKKDREDATLARRKLEGDDETDADALGDEDGAEPVDDPLAAYTVNFVEKAAAGRIDPLIGRHPEVERAIQVLARRRKNNPIFVGEPGVGKTAIVEGIAKAIFEGKVPSILQDHVIYSLDMGALLAGTKFRGQFEERLKGVIKAIVKDNKAILFIDEIHTIVGAGATAGGSMDASNILKPQLASGELRCIGSTTFHEYKQHFERDRALARRFQKIEVHEPSVDETVEILRGLKTQYEAHHDVVYTDEGLQAAAKLAAKFINDRMLPDKAIDVIDEAGAVDKLRANRKRTLGAREIEEVVAKMAKIPSASVSASDEVALRELDPALKRVIYGQDRAIDSLVAAIKLSRSGLAAADKPIGSFLFSGPTGVGKTELAKQLAKVMGVEFLRFDMTEYMEKHTVSRLIGAPPGYVGFDQGGLLTDAVRKTPHAVVVLDEIEKAHPDIYNILLQVMDHATLTDNNGRKADFRHVVIIMTTNAGAREMSARKPGFDFSNAVGGKAAPQDRGNQAIERAFAPEFRNRLDAWISFDSLPPEVIKKVVDKLVGELQAQLVDKKVTMELSPEARDWLAEHGFDAQFGARPMARLIQTELKKPLADELLFGALKAGGKVRVEVAEGKLTLRYEK